MNETQLTEWPATGLSAPSLGRRGFRLPSDIFGRASERIASFMGTAQFVVFMTVFIGAWLAWNTFAPADARFDPYTFTFLTLLLSLQASYAAPLILLAQFRQVGRDLSQAANDRRQAEIALANSEFLARELIDLRLRIGENQKAVQNRELLASIRTLTKQVQELQESINSSTQKHTA